MGTEVQLKLSDQIPFIWFLHYLLKNCYAIIT